MNKITKLILFLIILWTVLTLFSIDKETEVLLLKEDGVDYTLYKF